MKKEVHYLTYYNSLIKVLSLSRLYYMYDKGSKEKDEIIDQIEKVAMETLNHFENVNFNRPNYFYKESKLTPIPHFLFILKSNDEYLFINDSKNNIDTLNYYPSLFNDLNEEKKEIVVNKLKLNEELLPLIELKMIYYVKPIEDDNLNIPLPEYIFTFVYEFDEKKKEEILTSNKELIYLKLDDLRLNALDKKPINLNLFKNIVEEIKNSKEEILMR